MQARRPNSKFDLIVIELFSLCFNCKVLKLNLEINDIAAITPLLVADA